MGGLETPGKGINPSGKRMSPRPIERWGIWEEIPPAPKWGTQVPNRPKSSREV